MTPRRTKNGRMPPTLVDSLKVHNPRAAGIDVHAKEHWVAVPPDHAVRPPVSQPAHAPLYVCCFGTCTADLELLAKWLKECGITTVAMESTGVYWIPLFELLEKQGFQVYLVDPRQTKQVPGRPKTDVLDCQWIQRLHSYGLLAPSFRPEDQVVVLRSYLRQRQMLMSYASSHIQHMQKALDANGRAAGGTGGRCRRPGSYRNFPNPEHILRCGARFATVGPRLRNQRCRPSVPEIRLAALSGPTGVTSISSRCDKP